MRSFTVYLISALAVLILWAFVVFLVDLGPTGLTGYLISAFILVVCAFVISSTFVRRDYLSRGQLGSLSSFFQLLIWGLYFCFPYLHNPPNWVWFWQHETRVSPFLRVVALTSIVGGLVLLAIAIGGLGLNTSFSQKANTLKQTGLYRVTRNPQLIGCTPLIVGLALLWPSWYALGWVVLFAAIAHMMVLTEEQHLRKRFGEEYEWYCVHVPRYLGFPLRDSM